MNQKKISEKRFHVTGMGAALVDAFAPIDDAALAALGSTKGTMALITPDQAATLAAKMRFENKACGGASANTIAGLAGLGLNTGFIGKVANDDYGAFFAAAFKAQNIKFPTAPLTDGTPTGRCLVLITPDAERTMHTMIGAASALTPQDLDADMLAASTYFFSEGYVLDSPHTEKTFTAACALVKQAGGKIAFSLSDPLCATRHHARYHQLIKTGMDLLIGNEAEAHILFATKTFDQCRKAAQEMAQAHKILIIITRSEKGAVIIAPDGVTQIPAVSVPHIADLTGAGDQFAAGLLAGLARGHSYAQSGHYGALAAAEVIGHIGPRPIAQLADTLRRAGFEN